MRWRSAAVLAITLPACAESRVLLADAPGGHLGAPSRDGSVVSYVDAATGRLMLLETATGAARMIAGNATPEEFAYFSAPSPDGRRVAYAWFNTEGFYELRLVTCEAGKPAVARTLHRNKEHAFVQPAAWSPDGKSILTLLFRGDNTSQIAMIDASLDWPAGARGEMKVLKSLAWIYPNRMDLSPDGRFIVYDNASEPGRAERDIYILATDGTSERKLISGASNDVFPLWTPDGAVLFLREGELMLQAVREGEAGGEPRRLGVKLDRALLLGVTSAGSIVYAQRTGSVDVYVADADFDTGRLGEPRRASSSHQGGNLAPAWSMGGEALAYLTRIGVETFGQESRAVSLYDLATGGQKIVTPRLALMEKVAVSPDGGRLLISGSDRHGASGLFTFDLQSGRTAPLVRGEGGPFHGNWMHEGRSVVFTPPGGGAIRALNARTREASDILRADPGERFRLPVPSPDGKWIAYVRVRTGRPEAKPKSGGGAHMVETIEVGPLGGGEARTLITLRGGGAKSIGWLPGSKDVIVTSPGRPDGAAPAELFWRVSIDGGAARRLFELPSRGGVQLSPDGGKIAYASGAVKTELRLLRLPAGRRNSSAVFRSDRIHLGGNRRSIQPKE